MHSSKPAFLIDENLPLSLRDAIRLAGFTAYRLSDVGLKGAKDSVVAEYAVGKKLILVTLDKDFGYIYHKLYEGKLEVILLRIKPSIPAELVRTMNKLIQELDLSKHTGTLIIVTRKRIRIIERH
ncbi:MAG: DUF5615 family PIN-like protein [Thermoproteota archaeon]